MRARRVSRGDEGLEADLTHEVLVNLEQTLSVSKLKSQTQIENISVKQILILSSNAGVTRLDTGYWISIMGGSLGADKVLLLVSSRLEKWFFRN